MIEVKININTNTSENEKKKLNIPREAIDEFLGEGFASNTFEGDISFKCMPRAIDPSWMEVVVNLKDILETGLVLATVIRALVKFFKKCSGYEHTIIIDYQKNNKKFSCSIPIDKNSNEEEILKEIRKIIK